MKVLRAGRQSSDGNPGEGEHPHPRDPPGLPRAGPAGQGCERFGNDSARTAALSEFMLAHAKAKGASASSVASKPPAMELRAEL